MKKTVSLLLTVVMLLSGIALLSACGHECTFSTDWSNDATDHWHACEAKKDCPEIADKAAHTWDEGKITTEATHEAAGVKTYTCTVCAYTKTEEIPVIDACDPSTDWSHDATNHWHVCEVKNCTKTPDKAAHTWNEGEITTKPTQEAAGVKTFTCTVCSETKTENVAFTGLTKAEWEAIINTDLFDNYTLSMTIIASASGVQATSSMVYKITDDKIYMAMTAGGATQEETVDEGVAETKLSMAEDLVAMFTHSNFTYDAEAKLYRAKGKIVNPIDGSEASHATLRFENGKPVEMKYSYVVQSSGVNVNVDNTILFSDYGTTVIPD
ncbi:MAG: hypothetical protein IKJ35_01875 [Clostridia bacterium]|nr:hypothetical protein [Clostridia bacterium]